MDRLRDGDFSTGKFVQCMLVPLDLTCEVIVIDMNSLSSPPDRGIFVPFKKVVMAWNQ